MRVWANKIPMPIAALGVCVCLQGCLPAAWVVKVEFLPLEYSLDGLPRCLAVSAETGDPHRSGAL